MISWVPLFEEWLLTTNRFYRFASKKGSEASKEGSEVYKYNERSHVSILAGAAWRCGWGAICEFKRKKKGVGRAGRADLWIHSFDQQYLCEAKFKFVGPAANGAEAILQHACEDAKIKYVNREIPCGVAFLCPSFSRNQDQLEFEIHNFVSKIQNFRADAFAWSFPASERDTEGESNDYLPGIAMLVSLASQ